MARFTKKIRLTLILAVLVSAVTVPVRAVPYVEQGDIESYAKLREVERYQIKIAQKFYNSKDYKAAAAEFRMAELLEDIATTVPGAQYVSHDPPIITVEDFLTDEECASIIKIGTP